jgi:hypothetical protein
LETLHTAMRPRGVLFDVRPAPHYPWVELARRASADDGSRVGQLGQIDDSYRMGTLAVADAALQTIIAAGAFRLEHVATFTFIYRFDCVASWLAYMTTHWCSARLSPELIARASAEPPENTNELRVPRVMSAARFRRR